MANVCLMQRPDHSTDGSELRGFHVLSPTDAVSLWKPSTVHLFFALVLGLQDELWEMTRASPVLGALPYRVQAAIFLGSPKEGSGKRPNTMGAFSCSLSSQRRSKKHREGSNTEGKGKYFLIHSKNNNHDQRTTCHSYSKKKATTCLPAFLPFHARLSSQLGDEACGCRLASAPDHPHPQLLGTIELCL